MRNLIRQAKVEQIYSVMQTSSSRGMQTMEQSLADLALRRVITSDVAFSRSTRPDQLRGLLERGGYTDFSAAKPSNNGLADGDGGVDDGRPEEGDQALRPRAAAQAEGRRRQDARELTEPVAARPAKRELVGLKVGASQVAAARVMNNGSANLVQLARGPLDRGVVVGGEVRDVPALAQALDSFFEEHKLPRRGVRLGLATNRIGVRAFDVDGIADERQLANAIRFRAHEAVSIPIDEAVLDYHVVSETLDESGGVSRRILLAAAYRESIDRYIEACQGGEDRALRDRPRGVCAAARGWHDSGRLRMRAARAVVAVSLGHDRSTLAISDGDGLRVHARPRMGRRQARDGDRARSRRHLRRGASS